uniref:Uncharacterized protein n=1 Tax=Caenorhabditis japonica TaxID=281687 RepID=A0A8R1EJK7_CAEJA
MKRELNSDAFRKSIWRANDMDPNPVQFHVAILPVRAKAEYFEGGAILMERTVVKGKGETRKRLEACWKKLGADMSAYMQTFCGNHCVKLLEPRAVEQYLAVLQQSVDIPHVKGFLVAFGQFQKFCVARSLTGDEKEQMENAIDTIWTSLRRRCIVD